MSEVEICGGMSLPNEIRLSSDRFTTVARHEPGTGRIACQVRPHGESQGPAGSRRWPLPLTFRMLSQFWVGSGWLGKLLILGWLWLVVPTSCNDLPTEPIGWNLFGLRLQSMLIQLVIIFAVVKIWIGRWHAAEHMAIAAWTDRQAYDGKTIAAQSPVHHRCGGRFIFPLMVGFLFFPYLVQEISVSLLPFSSLLLFELVLQVDRWIGLWRIPVIRGASVLLQKHITTAPPTEQEIRTGQVALVCLLMAHKRISREDLERNCPELIAKKDRKKS